MSRDSRPTVNGRGGRAVDEGRNHSTSIGLSSTRPPIGTSGRIPQRIDQVHARALHEGTDALGEHGDSVAMRSIGVEHARKRPVRAAL